VENSKKAPHKISTFPGDEVLLGCARKISYTMGQVVSNAVRIPHNIGFKEDPSANVLLRMRVGAGVKADGRKGVPQHCNILGYRGSIPECFHFDLD